MKEDFVVGKIEQLTSNEYRVAIDTSTTSVAITANIIPATKFNLSGFVIDALNNTISWQGRILTTDKEIVDAMIELINERRK